MRSHPNDLILLPEDTPHELAAANHELLASGTSAAEEFETAEPALAVLDDQFPVAPPSRPRGGLRRILRGMVRPFIVLAMSQYVIVSIMIAAGAYTLSQQASHIINEKFAAITLALKRF